MSAIKAIFARLCFYDHIRHLQSLPMCLLFYVKIRKFIQNLITFRDKAKITVNCNRTIDYAIAVLFPLKILQWNLICRVIFVLLYSNSELKNVYAYSKRKQCMWCWSITLERKPDQRLYIIRPVTWANCWFTYLFPI